MNSLKAVRDDDEVVDFIAREQRFAEGLKKYRDAWTIEYDYALKFVQLPEKKRKELIAQGKQPVVSLDLDDIIRYSSGVIGATAIYFDLTLRGPGKDAADTIQLRAAVDVAKAAFMEKLHDVRIGYPRVRRRVIKMGQAARVGAAKLEVIPGGLYGHEVVPSHVDPRHIAWDGERFVSPLDYGCDEMWETIPRVSLKWAQNNPDFKRSFRDAITADDGERAIPASADPAVSKQGATDDDAATCTLKVGWIKADPEEIEVGLSTKQVPPQQWYMACEKCGYSEADLASEPGYDGSQLPEAMPCPQCPPGPEGQRQQMHRMDTETEIGRAPAYNKGHRRVVLAPFCPQAGLAKDGPWPEGLTDFPYMWHVPDPFPIEPYGNSNTSRNMDLQSLKNRTLRLGAEQMERNRDLTIVREDAFFDARHEPHMFDGSQDYVAFHNSSEPIGQNIHHFQGSGLNQAFGLFMDRLDAELGRHRGIGQISADAQQIKGMPVGTVARIQETGDVPLDEVIKILREDEEPFLTRWLELWLAHTTEAQWVDYAGPMGERAFRIFTASKMPAMKLKVTAQPSMNAVDVDKIEKISGLRGAPPELIRFALQDANVSPEIINGLIQWQAPPTAGVGVSQGPPAPPALAGAGG